MLSEQIEADLPMPGRHVRMLSKVVAEKSKRLHVSNVATLCHIRNTSRAKAMMSRNPAVCVPTQAKMSDISAFAHQQGCTSESMCLYEIHVHWLCYLVQRWSVARDRFHMASCSVGKDHVLK